MAHRGRLNILANIFGKIKIFSENSKVKITIKYFDGDVKYHLGLTDKTTRTGKKSISTWH
jgi:2-oxoglutarate dehydrogenase E1 component